MTTNDEQAPANVIVCHPVQCYVQAPNGEWVKAPKSEEEYNAMMNKPTERAPMFRRYFPDDEGEMHMDHEGEYVKYNDVMAKIASGELRVVKKGKWFEVNGYGEGGFPVTTWVHDGCDVVPAVEVGDPNARFCPGCGDELED